MRRIFCAFVLVVSAGSRPALAWGCDGHRAVAILAERLLSPAVLAKMRTVLTASPIDAAIKPYCPPVTGDPIAEASTWADDNRVLNPSTAGWHFIDFPRVLGANMGDYEAYCRNGNCIIDAIVSQYKVLTTTADPKSKGNALRYVIHFIGDLHQPLHTTTNGDRGGNCLPVTYYDQVPREDAMHNFRPNLHSVWDDSTIRRHQFMGEGSERLGANGDVWMVVGPGADGTEQHIYDRELRRQQPRRSPDGRAQRESRRGLRERQPAGHPRPASAGGRAARVSHESSVP